MRANWPSSTGSWRVFRVRPERKGNSLKLWSASCTRAASTLFINRWMTLKVMRSVGFREQGMALIFCYTRRLDTAFSTSEEEECPWVGDQLPAEMTTNAYIEMATLSAWVRRTPRVMGLYNCRGAGRSKRPSAALKGSLAGWLGSGRHADKPAAFVAKIQCRTRSRLCFHVGTGRARRFRDHGETRLIRSLGKRWGYAGSKYRARGLKLYRGETCRPREKSRRTCRQSDRLVGGVVSEVHGAKIRRDWWPPRDRSMPSRPVGLISLRSFRRRVIFSSI